MLTLCNTAQDLLITDDTLTPALLLLSALLITPLSITVGTILVVLLAQVKAVGVLQPRVASVLRPQKLILHDAQTVAMQQDEEDDGVRHHVREEAEDGIGQQALAHSALQRAALKHNL